MPNKAYWKKRQEDLQLGLMNNAENYTAEIENGYKTAMKEMEKQISVWYQRFADNNQVDMVTARRMLTDGEMQELKWNVETYIEYAEKNAIDPLWEKELENASARVHISRLEALKLQTRQQLEQLYGNRNAELTELIGSTYTDSLYKNGYENFIRTGIETHFDTIDKYKLNQVLSNPWTTDGVNFSDRLWSNKQQLIRTLNSEFIRAFSMGETPDNLARAISKRLGSDMRATKRLVMTESAYFATKGQNDCYNLLGVEEYEILGTLDSITCDECGGYDGKHFKREDMQAGINAPPFHPNCRCTTIPYFDDEFTKGEERAARNLETGKTEYVESMTYEEWKEKFVDKSVANGAESGIIKSGAVSGALDPNSQRAQEHANRYYESVRRMKTDVSRISENTGFSKEAVSQIKDFIFIQKHDLGGSEPEYFYPSYEMAESWQRLIDGKNIQGHDITLLKHEITERNLMKQGYSQAEAHKITEQSYNYAKESREYYAKIDKHNKE